MSASRKIVALPVGEGTGGAGGRQATRHRQRRLSPEARKVGEDPVDNGRRRCATALPREARDGLMRAWLSVLHDRHPNVTWVPAPSLFTETSIEPERAARRDQPIKSA
jgi:hypothetical protein